MLAAVRRTLADYRALHGRGALEREVSGVMAALVGFGFLARIFVMLEPLQ